MSEGPTWTLAKAAAEVSCSESTLRRKLKAGEVPDAIREGDTGPWSIPIASLVQIGLLEAVTAPESLQLNDMTPVTTAVDDSRMTALERDLSEWKQRAQLAEAVAEERALALGDLRQAMKMLEAGNTPPKPALEPVTTPPVTPKKWWQRKG